MVIKCQKCGARYNVDARHYGKSLACKCGARLCVPDSVLDIVDMPRQVPRPMPSQKVMVVVNQPKNESNPWGVFGLICVIASFPLLVVPVAGLIAGVVGFVCCLVGLFYRPRGAAGCGLMICFLPWIVMIGMFGTLLPSMGDFRSKINTIGKSEKLPKWEGRIIISDASFSVDRSGYRTVPSVSFTIRNDTKKAISRIWADAVLTSTGRKVPWIKDSFNYIIRGGLNPGETQRLNLDPGMFSEWATLENRSDYRLSITITRAEDENGNLVCDDPDADSKPEKSADKDAPKNLTTSDFIRIARQDYTWPRYVSLVKNKRDLVVFGGGKISLDAGANLKVEEVFSNGRLKLKDEASGKVFTIRSEDTDFQAVYREANP